MCFRQRAHDSKLVRKVCTLARGDTPVQGSSNESNGGSNKKNTLQLTLPMSAYMRNLLDTDWYENVEMQIAELQQSG